MNADILIVSGSILDGSGAPALRSDIAIGGDRVVAIGDLSEWIADETIDASGLVVAPGFIDTHTHDDRALIVEPDLQCKTSQGVTTVIAGNCGISAAPLTDLEVFPDPIGLLGERSAFYGDVPRYREALSEQGHAPNVALLAGHGVMRINALGDGYLGPADRDGIADMRRQMADALEAGCLGMSTGLQYPIAHGSDFDEIRPLIEVLADAPDAVYATHIRDEGDSIVESLTEAFDLTADTSVTTVISHHKCAGSNNHGRSVETLAMFDEVRARQPVALDVYPYIASSTVLDIEFVEKSSTVLVAYAESEPEATGRELSELADEWGMNIAEAVERLRPAAAVYFMMADQDLERILAYPATMIGSDGLPGMPHPHPRLWGTFPRVLGYYVRERQILTLPEAVHRMTGLPASIFGLEERGVLAEGSFADLVLLDPDTIADRATYESPTLPAAGIERVMANGQWSWANSAPTGNRTGRFLTH